MFTRAISLVALMFAASSSIHAGELTEEQTAELLNKIASLNKNRPYLQADFRESSKLRMTKDPIIRSGTLWLKLPNQFRREVPDNSIYVSDGSTFWIYYPAYNKTEVYPLGQERQVDDSLEALTAGFDLVRLGENYNVTAADAGAGWQLELTPKRGSLKKKLAKMTLWLGEDFTIERVLAVLRKGETLDTTFRNIKRGSIPDSTFKFAPPKDSEVARPLDR